MAEKAKKAPAPRSIYDGKSHRGETCPTATTVGELRKALERYPDELPIADGACLVWFNIGKPDEHLSVEENDGLWSE